MLVNGWIIGLLRLRKDYVRSPFSPFIITKLQNKANMVKICFQNCLLSKLHLKTTLYVLQYSVCVQFQHILTLYFHLWPPCWVGHSSHESMLATAILVFLVCCSIWIYLKFVCRPFSLIHVFSHISFHGDSLCRHCSFYCLY